MIKIGETTTFSAEDPRIDLTPLIDVVFMLIVFLLLTASATQLVISVDTPQSSSTEMIDTQPMLLLPPSAQDQGWIFEGQAYADADAVSVVLRQALEATPDRSLLIGIGAEVSSQRLVSAMDIARTAGVESVEIAVSRPDQ